MARDGAIVAVHLPRGAGSQVPYQFHPALLDACFQGIKGALDDQGETTPWVPVEVGSLRLFQPPAGELFCHVRLAPPDAGAPERMRADLTVVNSEGARVAEFHRFTVQRLASGTPHREEEDRFLRMDWEPAKVPPPKLTAGRWLLLGGGSGLGVALRSALEAAGHTVVHAVAPSTNVAGLRTLLTEAFAAQAPTAVVHLSSVDSPETLDLGAIELGLVNGCDSCLLYTSRCV